MYRYGFREEIEVLCREDRLLPSLFDKVERLARSEAGRYPPFILYPHLEQWDSEAFREIATSFITDYLFGENDRRFEYLCDALSMYADIDRLVVIMFRQYLSSLLGELNPEQANMIRRIGSHLRRLEKRGFIERKSPGGLPRYRRCGCKSEELIDEEALEQQSRDFPAWEPVRYGPEAEKVSPIIGEEDLLKWIKLLFLHQSGWIREKTLRSFFFKYLGLSQFGQISYDAPKSEKSPREFLESLLKERGLIAESPDFLMRIEEACNQLTERQQQVFMLYYQEGYSVEEITEELGVGKTTVYNELQAIRKIF